MAAFTRLAFVVTALLALTSCVTYPYASDFAACDAEAGACYRSCEYYEGTPDYGACHADCEYEIERCFDAAYAPYRYAGAAYGPAYVSPWYGTYGAWYPSSGYAVSMTVIKRYGYSPRRSYDRNRRAYTQPSQRTRSDPGQGGRNSWQGRSEQSGAGRTGGGRGDWRGRSDSGQTGPRDQTTAPSQRRNAPSGANQPSQTGRGSQPPRSDTTQSPPQRRSGEGWRRDGGSGDPSARSRSGGYRQQQQAAPQTSAPPPQRQSAPQSAPRRQQPASPPPPQPQPASPPSRSGDDVQRHDD